MNKIKRSAITKQLVNNQSQAKSLGNVKSQLAIEIHLVKFENRLPIKGNGKG